jgi:hypothetical protein
LEVSAADLRAYEQERETHKSNSSTVEDTLPATSATADSDSIAESEGGDLTGHTSTEEDRVDVTEDAQSNASGGYQAVLATENEMVAMNPSGSSSSHVPDNFVQKMFRRKPVP